MSKNLIPQIAQMLGVELGEEFKIKGAADWMLFHFEERGLRVRNVDEKVELSDGVDGTLFERLLGGYLEIAKIPWKPKLNERYWTFMSSLEGGKLYVLNYMWDNSVIDVALHKVGWGYRSRAEACAALPAVAKEMGVEFIV
jgi:hypothetical protein